MSSAIRFGVLALVLLGLVLAAALFRTQASVQPRLPVVATFSIVGDLVKNVGGDRIQLTVLVGPDGDVHGFEPTPSDAVALRQARVIFENGLDYETWLDRLYTASGSKAPRAVLNRNVTPLVVDREGRQEADPHTWLDVRNAIAMTHVVAEALSGVDPEGASVYQANAGAYIARLQELDGWALAQVASLPRDRRDLFTNHDTFGYLARRYGLNVAGQVVESFSTEDSPSAQRFAELVRDLRASGARVIFTESEHVSNPALVQQIAQAAGVRVGPALATDALTTAEGPAPSYIEYMTYNVRTIVAELGR